MAKKRSESKLYRVRGGYGTSPDYYVARLKRDRPDLIQPIIDGECSIRAAAQEAGIVPKRVSISCNPWNAAPLIMKHFKGYDLWLLLHLIMDEIPDEFFNRDELSFFGREDGKDGS